MAIYFDGFDDKMLSFYSESGRVGMLAYPVANKYVKECDSKSPNFMGFVRNVQGNLVGVQLGGVQVYRYRAHARLLRPDCRRQRRRKSGRGKGGNQAPGPLGRRHHRHGRFYSLIQEVM
jgi:hypothetical protein